MELARGRGTEGVRNLKIEINAYLSHEFSIGQCKGEGEKKEVSESQPFQLREVLGIGSGRRGVRVFRFNDGNDEYFVEAGKSFSFWEVDGMSIKDLRLHMLAEEWLRRQEVIDLDTARKGDPRVPSIAVRWSAIEEIAHSEIGGAERVQVLGGLFFPCKDSYIALVENPGTGSTFVIGSGLDVQRVTHSDAAPWRRLHVAIGEMLQSGKLPRSSATDGRAGSNE